MANGAAPPIGDMTSQLWSQIKKLQWSNGGWIDGGVTKWLHLARKSINFDCWFNLSDTSGVQLRLYMTEADFNTLKSWEYNENLHAWVAPDGKKYRLAIPYDKTLNKFRAQPVEVDI